MTCDQNGLMIEEAIQILNDYANGIMSPRFHEAVDFAQAVLEALYVPARENLPPREAPSQADAQRS